MTKKESKWLWNPSGVFCVAISLVQYLLWIWPWGRAESSCKVMTQSAAAIHFFVPLSFFVITLTKFISIRRDWYLEFNNNLLQLHIEIVQRLWWMDSWIRGRDADICPMESRHWWWWRRQVAVSWLEEPGVGGGVTLVWAETTPDSSREENIFKRLPLTLWLAYRTALPLIGGGHDEWTNRCKTKRLLLNEPECQECLPEL